VGPDRSGARDHGARGRPLPAAAEVLAEFRALPITPAVMEKWLWRNAAGLLQQTS